MAIKSDVGNGHKAYSAYDAVNGDFCATLEDVGINIVMTSQTYRKKGAYGFGAINADCKGSPSDVDEISEKSEGYCQDDNNKQATSFYHNIMKTCLYCKRKFKPVANRSVTCGEEECLKARKRDYHRAYMQRKKPRAKRLAYYIEYSQRPEVRKHLQEYHRQYYLLKKSA